MSRTTSKPATLRDVAREAGVSLLTASRALGNPGVVSESTIERVRAAMGRRPDGVVVAGLLRSPRAREKLHRLGLPVVETWDLSERPVAVVGAAPA